MFKAIALLAALGCMNAACSTARAGAPGSLVNGTTLEPVGIRSVVGTVRPGEVLILSEQHGFEPHHENQRQALRVLGAATEAPVSVGLEFFERRHQDPVDRFVSGALGEQEFLDQIDWGSIPFDHYRYQALFSRESGGRTLALNAARSLTSKVAKSGLDSLTPEERELLPNGFELGNAEYFERFRLAMQDHVPGDAIQRYFEAQSVWDEVMADSVMQHLARHPRHIVVVIVGDFHAAYGGGLPDRLRARGASRVHVISQIRTDGMSEEERRSEIEPHPSWGARADYIWITH